MALSCFSTIAGTWFVATPAAAVAAVVVVAVVLTG